MPFFKPEDEHLWHSSINYGGDRATLDFVAQNGWIDQYHDVFSTGGCARMAFAGLGFSLECLNDRSILRLYEGAPLELERKQKGDPKIQHVDMTLSRLRSLNSKGDDAIPALAEFISVIENCEQITVAGVRCYRLLIWSGPIDSPASFPLTLYVPHHSVAKGYIPRVGDLVNGLVIVYGTFLDKKQHKKPSICQPFFVGELIYKEDPKDKADDTPISEATEELEPVVPQMEKTQGYEYLPRQLESYPDACMPKYKLNKKGLAGLPKYVTYHEYKNALGNEDSLVQLKNISHTKLTALIREIDINLGRDFSSILTPVVKYAGVRHTAYNPDTKEKHIWIALPNQLESSTQLSNMLVAITADNKVARYTLINVSPFDEIKQRNCTLCHDYITSVKQKLTLRKLLNQIPKLKKNGFFTLTGYNQNDFLQAKCKVRKGIRTFIFEWQICDIAWQFGVESVSEERLIELVKLYWKKGLFGIEGEEPWKWIPVAQQYKDKIDKR